MASRGLCDLMFGAQALEGRAWLYSCRECSPNITGVPQVLEAVLVEQLVEQARIEALRKRTLNGLHRADEVVLDAVAIGTGVERAATHGARGPRHEQHITEPPGVKAPRPPGAPHALQLTDTTDPQALV